MNEQPLTWDMIFVPSPKTGRLWKHKWVFRQLLPLVENWQGQRCVKLGEGSEPNSLQVFSVLPD